ncbi:MAG TPA: FecR domain-containing protein [Thermoanaerobaculia bacterium]|nr:FecR domain-containing protein [Thermoanaerobaculia bacterium]
MNEHDEKDPIATLVRLAGRRPEVNAERTARVRAAVADEWRATVRRRRIVRLGIAAALAAVISGALLLRRDVTRPAPAPAPMAAENTHAVEWNGGTLRVARGTRLRIDGPNTATLVHGAVYYADEKREAGITLHTPFGDVRDVGTRFEARVGENSLRVRVRDGEVRVRDRVARAGMELFATKTTIEERSVATSGADWAWIEEAAPPLVLEGKTFDAVLRTVATEKGLTLDWNGGTSQTLHGDVPLSINEALDAATAAAGATYRIEGDRLIVRGRS